MPRAERLGALAAQPQARRQRVRIPAARLCARPARSPPVPSCPCGGAPEKLTHDTCTPEISLYALPRQHACKRPEVCATPLRALLQQVRSVVAVPHSPCYGQLHCKNTAGPNLSSTCTSSATCMAAVPVWQACSIIAHIKNVMSKACRRVQVPRAPVFQAATPDNRRMATAPPAECARRTTRSRFAARRKPNMSPRAPAPCAKSSSVVSRPAVTST